MLICYLNPLPKSPNLRNLKPYLVTEKDLTYKHQLLLFNETIKLVDVITRRKIQTKFPSTYLLKKIEKLESDIISKRR